MYLKAYSQSISALRGEEFWEFTSACELLPPEMPTALRGRPKRLRRREEWEGGTQNKGQANMSQVHDVPDLQKYRGGKVMHCSLCKKPGHKKTTLNKQSGTCRPKLPVRRPAAPGVVIKDPIPTPKTTPDLNDVLKKNKDKVSETSCTKRKDKPYWMTNCLRKKKP
ncbi:hypothetical protein DCAR_0935099 [Daucus carota subsp. sativus]|uniref:Uncharacterized protein n=1 Tax=Daucus carota subsp. sativus TaxID=79200 RepID=A0AAF0XY26_DAUCS|nr:hypothetical protein DCAR_0935099 [Daucus carota subsp. sativus]